MVVLPCQDINQKVVGMTRNFTIWDEMRRMQEEMDALFSRMESRPLLSGSDSGKSLVPFRRAMADVRETDKEIIAQIELPGAEKADIKLNATEDGIEVKAEKKAEVEKEEKGTYSYQKRYAGFYRYIGLPLGADVSKVDATFKNGLLEIHVPKKEGTKKKATEIQIK